MPARRFAVIPQGGGVPPQTAIPLFSPGAGTYAGPVLVTITCATFGATIHFTIDGSIPTTSSPVYSGPITIPSTETLNAVALANGYILSLVDSATYTITSPQAATPTFSPGAGNYSSSQSVAISCSTPSSSIFYTTNGSTPTTGSTPYTTPITVSSAETVQAIATASGFTQSAVGSAAYTFNLPTGLMKFGPGNWALAGNGLYNTTPAQVLADLQQLLAAAASAGVTLSSVFQGYVFGEQWTTFDKTTVSTSPVYDFNTTFWAIINLMAAVWPTGKPAFRYAGNHYTGTNVTVSNISAANMGSPGFFVPSCITSCGGSLTVQNSFGSGSTTTYPVAAVAAGSPNYGLNFQDNNGAGAFETVTPQWYNPGVMRMFRNSVQAFFASTGPAPTVYNSVTTYSLGQQVTSGGLTYTWINATAGSNHAPPNATFWTQATKSFVGLTPDQVLWSFGFNDEVSNAFISSDNIPGVTVNPPLSVSGAAPTNTNFWIQYCALMQDTVAAAPTTIVAPIPTFSWGAGSSVDTGTNMAANWNANCPSGNRSAPIALSSIKGIALSAADTYGFEWISNNNRANNCKQGFYGIVVPGPFGGTLPTPTVPNLIGLKRVVSQVQAADYFNNVSGAGNNASAVTQVLTAAEFLHSQEIQWCLLAKTNSSGAVAFPPYLFPTLIANPLPTACFLRDVDSMAPVTINAVTVASATSLTVTWTPYALDPAEQDLGYSIYRNGTRMASGQTSGTFTDIGLTSGTTYTYTIGMDNTNGTGPVGAGVSGTPQGAVQIFSFPNFNGSPNIHIGAGGGAVSGGTINFPNSSHNGGGVSYGGGVENIQSFTTDFTFVIPNAANYGMVFSIQNSNNTTNPFAFGINGGGNSANGLGWGAGGGSGQPALGNSIGLVFTVSPFNQASWFVSPAPISNVALCVDGGPAIGGGAPFGVGNGRGYAPVIDTHPFGLNVASGNLIHCYLVYDGTILTMVLTDTVTLATTRQSWPVNIPAIVGANTAFLTFCQSQPDVGAGQVTINSWNWSQGYNTRLATPTFSVPAGQYTGTQTVALSGPVGASIYYTTNGTPPTTASTLYTSAITVSSSQVIQAVAIQSGFTDSYVAQAFYEIQASATPTINFPSGFASTNGLIQPMGNAKISGSNLVLTDTANTYEAAAAWFVPQVNLATFSTTFALSVSGVNGPGAGLTFVLQNYPQTNTGTNFNWNLGNGPFGVTVVSGGPYMLTSPADGGNNSSLGYVQIFNSIGVVFDINGNSVGLYTNGTFPGGSQVAITGGVSLTGATAITAKLDYNNVAAPSNSLVLKLTQGANVCTLTLSASINMTSTVGATGFAGFSAVTGGTAGNVASIQIPNWTM